MGKSNTMILIVASVMASCALFDSGGETIKGHYNVVWIDTPDSRSICYANEEGELGGIQKVGEFIKRIGNNDRYIIAERTYQYMLKVGDRPRPDSICYYIIDMNCAGYNNEDVIGPFTKKEFETKKLKMGIVDLKFTREYSR